MDIKYEPNKFKTFTNVKVGELFSYAMREAPDTMNMIARLYVKLDEMSALPLCDQCCKVEAIAMHGTSKVSIVESISVKFES